jgi:hypothetical protein
MPGQPFEICPCGRFDQFEERARLPAFGEADQHGDHRRLGTLHRGIHHGSAVVSRRLLLTFSALTCWFLELPGWISVTGFASRSAPSRGTRSHDWQTTTTVNCRDGLNGKDVPPEKNPIVTQFVTQDRHASIAHSL